MSIIPTDTAILPTNTNPTTDLFPTTSDTDTGTDTTIPLTAFPNTTTPTLSFIGLTTTTPSTPTGTSSSFGTTGPLVRVNATTLVPSSQVTGGSQINAHGNVNVGAIVGALCRSTPSLGIILLTSPFHLHSRWYGHSIGCGRNSILSALPTSSHQNLRITA
jgi:hypothetical protein